MKYLLPLLAFTLLLTACSSTPPRRVHWQTPGYENSEAYAAGQRDAESRTERRNLWGADLSVRESSIASATRRNLYSPGNASGPYTRALQDGSWRYASKTADEQVRERREQEEIQAMQAVPKAKP